MWRRFRFAPLLYCITDVRLMTFKSAIFARSLRISSCTPSAKNAFSGSALRFSNGNIITSPRGIGLWAVILSPKTSRLPPAVRAINNPTSIVVVGFRPTHFRATNENANAPRANQARAVANVRDRRPALRRIDSARQGRAPDSERRLSPDRGRATVPVNGDVVRDPQQPDGSHKEHSLPRIGGQ